MDEKNVFTRQFREIQPKFSRIYARLLSEANLTLPQFALLSLLVDRGHISMTEISSKLHITKPAVTSLADRLEKAGFLKRLPHARDRRISLLEIQGRGARIVRKTQGRALGFLLKAFDRMNSAEKKTISRFYTLLSQILDEALKPARKR